MLHRLSGIGSERATGGRGGKIVTFDGIVHVVWQDISREGYLNRVRSLRRGVLTEAVTLNTGVDNHARPVITVDSRGYLHTIMSGHGSPITYRRSLRPNDSTEWEPPERAGAGTYPILLSGPGDVLYFTVRAADADGVDLYRKAPMEPSFTLARKLVSRTPEYREGYAAFHNYISIGPDGTLHFAVTFYEGTGRTDHRGLHQAVCYMRSRDGGLSWERSNGTPVTTPATPETMDVLYRSTGERHEPMPPPEIVMGEVLPRADGSVIIPCISHEQRAGELVLHSIDPGGTRDLRQITALEERYPDSRPIALTAGIRSDETIYMLVTLAPLHRGWLDGKPLRDANPDHLPDLTAVWLTERDGEYEVLPAIEAGTKFNTVTIERPFGVNSIDPANLPAYAYFDGTSEYPRGLNAYFEDVAGYVSSGELISNSVFLHEARLISIDR